MKLVISEKITEGIVIMALINQKRNAKQFISRWKNRGNEKQDSQSFWIDLLQSVYGVENPSEYISFESNVLMDHNSFLDGYIEKTNVLIEQKSSTKDLNKAIKQSDGSYLTPFQQAKRYSANLPFSRRPRWIVTCNFKEFYVYDMERPNSEASIIKLEDLDKEYYRLEFLIERENVHIEKEIAVSVQAGEIVSQIYSKLLEQYIDPTNEETLKSINQLCVRIVFCLYAEDAGIFGTHAEFHDYLTHYEAEDMREALINLFKVLNTPYEERSPYLNQQLSLFPYVNGGMFSSEDIEIPNFNEELRELIIETASNNFNWSKISPTIFGAVFESTLNPDTRRSGGMHYTSIENIHKVIDPLFLDDLRAELDEIKLIKQKKTMTRKVEEFQNKLSSLSFFERIIQRLIQFNEPQTCCA